MAIRREYLGLECADELMAFIRDHWSTSHVLARSRALLDWQHRDEAQGRYNFLVARDDTDALVGIMGFIPASRYDPAVAASAETVWLTTWKVIDGQPAGLGIILLRDLAARLQPLWIGTSGLNPQTRGIYDAMGYRTGLMARHYRLAARAEYRLAHVPSGWPIAAASSGGTLTPVEVAAFADLALGDGAQAPTKSLPHFRKRYLEHPFYDYRLYRANKGNSSAVIATRLCEHDGATALRIVDLLGDPAALADCGAAFDALLAETGAEYVDFYCSETIEPLLAAGFALLDFDGPLVLPSYFEPFERSNVNVLWSLKGPGERLVICKGDCDQDRPSLLGVP